MIYIEKMNQLKINEIAQTWLHPSAMSPAQKVCHGQQLLTKGAQEHHY